ncbi:hypothetical protein [Kitasatospora sp. DSM 101779]|uniref:hypothetical protein n=1 Tax=Kitasatospora sp. DSM 101779 TaxID=2853165 RepID=UPI0021DA0D58|nr:hypothetical protein [Kitasatospora sp. DSM 101779]MCU7824850.1 hypothetical protein [Kitasatospora sp. DSM 101779]
MDAIGVVIALVMLFLVAAAVMAVVGTVKAAKAVAAKVERHEAHARRAVENAALRAKTFTKPGSQGQLAAVRLSLRTSLDATRQVLESGLAEDSQLAESLQLLNRLDAHAAELDREMRILEREPDSARLATKLPELRERAGRITHAAETMRWAAQDRMRRFADDDLARLGRECENEAGALRHWDRVDGSGDPDGAGAAASAAGAGTGAGSGARGTGAQSDGVSAAAGGTAAARSEETQRKGLTAGNRLRAEDVLGLGEPLNRLADRLRKPNTGGA